MSRTGIFAAAIGDIDGHDVVFGAMVNHPLKRLLDARIFNVVARCVIAGPQRDDLRRRRKPAIMRPAIHKIFARDDSGDARPMPIRVHWSGVVVHEIPPRHDFVSRPKSAAESGMHVIHPGVDDSDRLA